MSASSVPHRTVPDRPFPEGFAEGSSSSSLDWELYLTRLESWARQAGEIARPQDMVEGGAEREQVPAPEAPVETPLPAELRDRAQTVLDTLTQASARTRAVRFEVGRQLAALRQVPPRDSGEARYLDTTG